MPSHLCRCNKIPCHRHTKEALCTPFFVTLKRKPQSVTLSEQPFVATAASLPDRSGSQVHAVELPLARAHRRPGILGRAEEDDVEHEENDYGGGKRAAAAE